MRPHSPNYTLSSHHYLKLCPRHTGTRASDRNIVMGARREAGGCERHQIFSGNWSVIVKTSPIILSHVTSVDKLNYQRKKVKTENVEFELFHVYYFSVFCTRRCAVCHITPLVCVCRTLRLGQAQWISPPAAGSQGVINPCHSATSSRLTTKMVLVRLEQPPCQ